MTEEQQLIKHPRPGCDQWKDGSSPYDKIQSTEHYLYNRASSEPGILLKIADARALKPGPVSEAFILHLNELADELRENAAKMIHQARLLHNAAQALTDLNSPETEETCTPHLKTPTE